VLTNLAFTALGTVFDYPDVLSRPAAEVLAAFRADQTAIVTWFTVLALSAALFAPIAVGAGRLSRHPAMRAAVPVGVAAAVVQVLGLARWPVLVPGYAARDDLSAFTTAHRLLGTVVGETLGYTLTAAWTLLVLTALHRAVAGRWFTWLGGVSAVLILLGVLTRSRCPAWTRPTSSGTCCGACGWWRSPCCCSAARRSRTRGRRPSVPGPDGTAQPSRQPGDPVGDRGRRRAEHRPA
jgi:hypothetical protein